MIVCAEREREREEVELTVGRAAEAAGFFLPVVPTTPTDTRSLIAAAVRRAVEREREGGGRGGRGGGSFVTGLALGRPGAGREQVDAAAARTAAVRYALATISGSPSAAATQRALAGPTAASAADRLLAAAGRPAKQRLAAALASLSHPTATAAPACRSTASEVRRSLRDSVSASTAAALDALSLLSLSDPLGASFVIDGAYAVLPGAAESCLLAEVAARVAAERERESGDAAHLLRAARFATLPLSPSPTCWHLRALALHAYIGRRWPEGREREGEGEAERGRDEQMRSRLLALRDDAAARALNTQTP
jgi:hypothetical protein